MKTTQQTQNTSLVDKKNIIQYLNDLCGGGVSRISRKHTDIWVFPKTRVPQNG